MLTKKNKAALKVTPWTVNFVVIRAPINRTSQRGVGRIAGLAYNTGVDIIRAASHKSQQVHNAEVQNIEAVTISADELYPWTWHDIAIYLTLL